MKLYLLGLLPALLPLGFNNEINDFDTKILSESNPAETNKFAFEKDRYFLLSENIIEKADEVVTYESISTYFTFNEQVDIKTNITNPSICEISPVTYIKEENKYKFDIKGLSQGSTYIDFSYGTYSQSIKVDVIKSYTNFKDIEITKPTSTKSDPYKFDFKLIEGDNISNIKNDNIDYEIISNENNCIKVPSIFDYSPEYGIRLQTTENIGTAKIKCRYFIYDTNRNKIEVDSFIITIHVVNNENYFSFYTLKDGQFLDIPEKNPLKVESFSKISIYIGNLTNQFSPSDIEIKNYNELGGLSFIELKEDKNFDFPMVCLDVVPGPSLKNYSIEIGIKNSKKTKKIVIDTLESKHHIEVNVSALSNYYFITDAPDLYKLCIINPEFVKLIDTKTNENVLKDYLPVFTSIQKRLGKQRVYVFFDIEGNIKVSSFDIKLTMNSSFNKNGEVLSDDSIVNLYKSFLNYVLERRPSFYSAEEAYKDLEYEYLNSLSDNAKKYLSSDFDFIRSYRRFISTNNITTSFFNEIDINLGMNRYIAPILIICLVSVSLLVTFGISYNYVHKRKGYEDD